MLLAALFAPVNLLVALFTPVNLLTTVLPCQLLDAFATSLAISCSLHLCLIAGFSLASAILLAALFTLVSLLAALFASVNLLHGCSVRPC
jgi:hypothetical protein